MDQDIYTEIATYSDELTLVRASFVLTEIVRLSAYNINGVVAMNVYTKLRMGGYQRHTLYQSCKKSSPTR